MLQVGDILEQRYRIDAVLGQGGMGAVYRAQHLQLDEPVAIKEMVAAEPDPESLDHFRQEARILRKLRHANLPLMYDFLEAGHRHYLVMEYVDGKTLDALVQQQGPLPEAAVLDYARQLCDVLGYLHDFDPPVIFRDLKPSNIMVRPDGTVRLIDFGIAKLLDPTTGLGTRTGLRGAMTPGYAAPEQYGAGTDAATDVYALGATLYALLSGGAPPESVHIASGMTTLCPLQEIRTDLAPTTLAAIQAMMAIARQSRPKSMREVRALLQSVPPPGGFETIVPPRLASPTLAPAVAEPPRTMRVSTPTRSGVPWPLVAVMTGLVALVSMLAWIRFNSPVTAQNPPMRSASPVAVASPRPSPHKPARTATPRRVAVVTRTPVPTPADTPVVHQTVVLPPPPVTPSQTGPPRPGGSDAITPGGGIGQVSLGMSMSSLGHGGLAQNFYDTERVWLFPSYEVAVATDSTDHITEVHTQSRRFSTAQGLRVGDSESQVLQVMGPQHGPNPAILDYGRLAFVIYNGHVAYIVVK